MRLACPQLNAANGGVFSVKPLDIVAVISRFGMPFPTLTPQESVRNARAQVSVVEEAVIAKSKAAADATDQFVHENPWPSIGVVAAIGVVVGILIGNSRR